jgi:hypothetical protein
MSQIHVKHHSPPVPPKTKKKIKHHFHEYHQSSWKNQNEFGRVVNRVLFYFILNDRKVIMANLKKLYCITNKSLKCFNYSHRPYSVMLKNKLNLIFPLS